MAQERFSGVYEGNYIKEAAKSESSCAGGGHRLCGAAREL